VKGTVWDRPTGGEEVKVIGAEDFKIYRSWPGTSAMIRSHLTEQLELLKRMVGDKDRHICLLEKDLGKGRLRSIIKV
jgi:hypothetical protein